MKRFALHLYVLALIGISYLFFQWHNPGAIFADAAPALANFDLAQPARRELNLTELDVTTMTLQRDQNALAPVPGPFAFGAAVAHRDGDHVAAMGFNWMITYDPPHRREPVNVLYRVPVNHYSVDPNDYRSRWQFADELYRLAGEQGDWIDAYEIGNEVNLYVNGWDAPPNPQAYVDTLCMAYKIIKLMDPTALVVSAGLAPVGRVQGNWNGLAGHNYLTQDEREFFRAFLRADGDECTDVFGYHPLGFSANFDVAPDTDGDTPETNCTNGFCFRGIEKFYEVLQASGKTEKPIWATEVGWIVEPDDPACLDDYSWEGRQWQRVTREKQAENLVGAFTYAHEHWPWLQGIFVFNLNFHGAPYYHACEQMRYYSIQSTATETALRGMIADLFDFVYLPVVAKSGSMQIPSDDCATDQTIYAELAANGNFTLLLRALDHTGVSAELLRCDPITIFAPTDAAFIALLNRFGLTMEQLLTLPELPETMRYHIVPGNITMQELADGTSLPTLADKPVLISREGETVRVNGATIIAGDVSTVNGTIHLIDGVLIPPAD